MSNLNWPEGATHYLQAGEEQTRFRDLSGEQWKYFNSYTGEWVQHYFSSEDLLRRHDLIARPQPKPWSGPEDGLPPVGAKVLIGPADGCEWLENFEGREAEIIAHNVGRSGDPTAVFKCFDDDGFPIYHAMVDHPSNFRAIKHEEDKRETAIRELMDIAGVDCRVTAARLVDAGFKREAV